MLDIVGHDDGGKALGDDLPAIVILRAGQDLGLRIGEGCGRAGRGADARRLLELLKDAFLHRHRKADRPQLLAAQIGRLRIGQPRGQERSSAADGERHHAGRALEERAAIDFRIEHLFLQFVQSFRNRSLPGKSHRCRRNNPPSGAIQYRPTRRPPSTTSTWPVMYLAASEARNAIDIRDVLRRRRAGPLE